MVQVYPNPAVDNVRINSVGTNLQQVLVFDLKGRNMISENVNSNEFNLSVSDLPSGIYILKVKTGEGTAVKRLMKK